MLLATLLVGAGALAPALALRPVQPPALGRAAIVQRRTNTPLMQEELAAWQRPARLAIAATWASAIVYVAAASPGGSAEAAARDTELIISALDPTSDLNPIFFCVFNALGIMPGVYAATLLPGARQNKPVPPATIATSFALGFGGLAPYLALREARPSATAEDLGPVARYVTESKLFCAAPLLAGSLALAFKLATIGDFDGALGGYAELFATSRLVHVSSLDLIVLSLFFFEPAREDMCRRGWWAADGGAPTSAERARLLAFCALHVIGPALYLLLRPELPSVDEM